MQVDDDADDDMIDDYDSEDDDENMLKTADKLKVFCVSSAEFLKMKFPKKSQDGPPTVSRIVYNIALQFSFSCFLIISLSLTSCSN